METGLTKNQILSELAKSPHGKLQEYLPVGKVAATQEPEFMAHLIAWDRIKGDIRDAKVALPVIAMTNPKLDEEFRENALAHLAKLGPRELERAFRFALEIKLPGRYRVLQPFLRQYLLSTEKDRKKWDRLAIQHRATLANLYSLAHMKPQKEELNDILFKNFRPAGSVFEMVAQLKNMTAVEAAGAIIESQIPFLVAKGALGKKIQEPELVLALIKRMSPTELVTSMSMLEDLGVKTNPMLRGALDEAIEKASKSRKNVLKTTRAAEKTDDDALKQRLQGLQEKQLQSRGGIEGNWLVLGDKSGSMASCIEGARLVAATLAKMVKGKVHLIFFDNVPARVFDVTGQSYEDVKKDTRHVTADGGTSIGCGLQYAIDRKLDVDGIAIVSDGDENQTPRFHDMYPKYCAFVGKDVPVYLYRYGSIPGSADVAKTMKSAGHDLQEFKLTGTEDYYSLPDLAATMRTNRYSLIEEILTVPLLKLADALKQPQGREVAA